MKTYRLYIQETASGGPTLTASGLELEEALDLARSLAPDFYRVQVWEQAPTNIWDPPAKRVWDSTRTWSREARGMIVWGGAIEVRGDGL